MRFLTEYHGSKEPSVILVGESQDFLELAATLEEKVHQALQGGPLEGALDLPGLQIEGPDRLSFGLTTALASRTLPTAKEHSCLQGILVCLTGLATVYFFCRGLGVLFF